jgi:hypothetical protein
LQPLQLQDAQLVNGGGLDRFEIAGPRAEVQQWVPF